MVIKRNARLLSELDSRINRKEPKITDNAARWSNHPGRNRLTHPIRNKAMPPCTHWTSHKPEYYPWTWAYSQSKKRNIKQVREEKEQLACGFMLIGMKQTSTNPIRRTTKKKETTSRQWKKQAISDWKTGVNTPTVSWTYLPLAVKRRRKKKSSFLFLQPLRSEWPVTVSRRWSYLWQLVAALGNPLVKGATAKTWQYSSNSTGKIHKKIVSCNICRARVPLTFLRRSWVPTLIFVLNFFLILNFDFFIFSHKKKRQYHFLFFFPLLWFVIRSYHTGNTGSHSNSEVKQYWACLVLRWGTTREPYVANDKRFVCFFFFFCYVLLLPSQRHWKKKKRERERLSRQQWDLNPRGQSPLDFESNALDHSAILSCFALFFLLEVGMLLSFFLSFFLCFFVSCSHWFIHWGVNSSMVRIRASQAWGPGSIPGWRISFFFLLTNQASFNAITLEKKSLEKKAQVPWKKNVLVWKKKTRILFGALMENETVFQSETRFQKKSTFH